MAQPRIITRKKAQAVELDRRPIPERVRDITDMLDSLLALGAR